MKKIGNFLPFQNRKFKKMKNKKAMSHVEIMISFVIFVGFLIFFYVIIEPAIKGPQSSETILQDLEESFLNGISDEVFIYNLTLNWDEVNPGACTNIGNCIKVESPSVKNASVIEGEQSLDYYSDYSSISIWCGGGNCEDEDKFTIYYADSFDMKKTTECQLIGLDPDCYKKDFLKKRNYIFENKIEAFKNKFNEINGYEQLKEDLKIPAKYDLWFDFLDEKRISKFTEWKSPDIPENVNVYASEIPITYISKDEQNPETKKDGFLIIKMWG